MFQLQSTVTIFLFSITIECYLSFHYNYVIILELWPSIKCHIHTFILTLFVDDIGFSSKAVISMTLDNIAATLDANQVNAF